MRWLFLVVTFLALPTISSAQFSNLDEAGKQLVARLKPLKPVLVAVADFNSPDRTASAQCHYLSWYLSSSLEEHGKKKLRVADHQAFDKDLQGILSSHSAVLTPQLLHEFAPRIGADIVVIGSVVNRDSSYYFEITPVQVAHGTTLESFKTSIRSSEFMESLMAPFPAGGAMVLQAGMKGAGVPKCIHCPDPSYTARAQARELQGIAVLELIISADGTVEQLHPLKLLGYGLDESAYNKLKSWKFKPATDEHGNPIPVRVPVEVLFRLY